MLTSLACRMTPAGYGEPVPVSPSSVLRAAMAMPRADRTVQRPVF
jgi:hypothetical protein